MKKNNKPTSQSNFWNWLFGMCAEFEEKYGENINKKIKELHKVIKLLDEWEEDVKCQKKN